MEGLHPDNRSVQLVHVGPPLFLPCNYSAHCPGRDQFSDPHSLQPDCSGGVASQNWQLCAYKMHLILCKQRKELSDRNGNWIELRIKRYGVRQDHKKRIKIGNKEMYRAVKQVILMVEMVVRDRDVIIISQSTSMEPVEVSVAATGLTCPDDYFMMSLATGDQLW